MTHRAAKTRISFPTITLRILVILKLRIMEIALITKPTLIEKLEKQKKTMTTKKTPRRRVTTK